MSRSGRHVPGGGLRSRVVKHSTAPKVEPRSRAINPGGVNMLGNHVGDHITHVKGSTGYRGEPLVRGSGYSPPQGPTDNVKAVGVGGGRTIYEYGTQCQTGTNPGNPHPNSRRDPLEQE